MKKKAAEEVKEEFLKLKVTSETLSELHSLIKEKGWEIDEGFRIILGAGYGYLSSHPDIGDDKQTGLPKTSEQLIERLVKAEARLGSMRYRAYEIQQTNSSWELSTGAIHHENVGLRNVAKRRLEEVDGLRLKVKALEEELEKLNRNVSEYEDQKVQSPENKNLLNKFKVFKERFK